MPFTFLITSGPTREYIDPVRFISNASSGRMGAALAACAKGKKQKVIFITGPAEIQPPAGVTVVPVTTAAEMFAAVKRYLPSADVFISAAAVADYRPLRTARHKLKKGKGVVSLALAPTVDILAYAGRNKRNCVLVGFALESKDLLKSAKEKLERKNLDLIVANTAAAIGKDSSSCWLLGRDGSIRSCGQNGKRDMAEKIINEALRIRQDGKTA